MNRASILTLCFLGLIASATLAAAIQVCVMPMVTVHFVDLHNLTIPAFTVVCDKEIVNHVMFFGIDPDSAYLFDESEMFQKIVGSEIARSVVTGIYSTNVKSSIKKIIIPFRPTNNKTIEFFPPGYETESSNGWHCFGPNTIVDTQKGTKNIRDLQLGDMVRSGPTTFTEFLGWLDHQPNQYITFHRIIGASGNSISVTDKHIISVVKNCNEHSTFDDAKPTFAQEVEFDDCLIHIGSDNDRRLDSVRSIEKVIQLGAFAPYFSSDIFYAVELVSYSLSENPGFIEVTPYSLRYPTTIEKNILDYGMVISLLIQDQNNIDGVNPVVNKMCQVAELFGWIKLQAITSKL